MHDSDMSMMAEIKEGQQHSPKLKNILSRKIVDDFELDMIMNSE